MKSSKARFGGWVVGVLQQGREPALSHLEDDGRSFEVGRLGRQEAAQQVEHDGPVALQGPAYGGLKPPQGLSVAAVPIEGDRPPQGRAGALLAVGVEGRKADHPVLG